MVQRLLILMFQLLAASVCFGQGAAIFSPLSETVYGNATSIAFQVTNRTGAVLELNIVPICEVDGRELEGEACWNYFKLRVDGRVLTSRMSVPAQQASQATLQRISSVSTYAFFKAKFQPQVSQAPSGGGVAFVFDYQPGYLFIVKPRNPPFALPAFAVETTDAAKIAKFNFDTKKLAHPEVVSISAKLIDRKSNRLVRFLRIANDKIVDPKRGDFQVSGQFAAPEDSTDVCYQLYMQRHAYQDPITKYSNCDGVAP